MLKNIWIISKDILRSGMRLRLMYGLLLIAFIFLLMSNIPFLLKDTEVFKDQSPLKNALQIGFVFIHFFSILIAIAVSISILKDYLIPERLILLFSKPITHKEFFLGMLLGMNIMVFLNWIFLVFSLWISIFFHTAKLNLFIFSGFFPAFLIEIICVGLVIFFYRILPNFLSGLLCFLIILAGFGGSLEDITEIMPGYLGEVFSWTAKLLPKINSLWGISMKLLDIFPVRVNITSIVLHTLLFISGIFLIDIFLYRRIGEVFSRK